MKINGIKALDYEHQGATLVLILSGTTLEEVTGMDASLVEIRTDEGDLVEAFAGYALRSVTYDTAAQTYTATLTTEASDNTAAALSQMAEDLAKAKDKVNALESANTELAGQVAELTGAIERGLTQ